MIALTAAPPGDQAYTVVYILIAVMGLVGGGGLFGFWKSAKRQGARDAQLDRVIDVVLPDKNGKGGLVSRLDDQDRQLADIAREAKPNGGNTRRLGDTVKRTEDKVDDLTTKMDQHIGSTNARLSKLESR